MAILDWLFGGSKKKASPKKKRKTTKKGSARKGKPAGSRLGYDDLKKKKKKPTKKAKCSTAGKSLGRKKNKAALYLAQIILVLDSTAQTLIGLI